MNELKAQIQRAQALAMYVDLAFPAWSDDEVIAAMMQNVAAIIADRADGNAQALREQVEWLEREFEQQVADLASVKKDLWRRK